MHKHTLPFLCLALLASSPTAQATDISGLTPGSLGKALDGVSDTRQLTLSGTINAADFATLLHDVNDLQTLNLANVRIAQYQGDPLPYTLLKSSPENAIPPYAFTGLTSLKSITLPSSLKQIGTGAFSGSGITSVVIPADVSQIDAYAFMRCSSLTSVSFPTSLEAIGERAFAYCPSLSTITFAENDLLQSIPQGLFEACGGIKTIDLDALAQCAEIGPWALAECDGITTLVLPQPLETIGESAMTGDARINTLILPKTLSYIDSDAMSGMSGLETIKAQELSSVPQLGAQVWRDVNQVNVSLVVADDMGQAFLDTPQWQDFKVVSASDYESSTDDIKSSVSNGFTVKVTAPSIVISSLAQELSTISVFNVNGHLMAAVKGQSKQSVTINTQGWTPGVYLVVCNAGMAKVIL